MHAMKYYYLICCCLESNINYRCLYTLGDRCFVASTASYCRLDLVWNKTDRPHYSRQRTQRPKYTANWRLTWEEVFLRTDRTWERIIPRARDCDKFRKKSVYLETYSNQQVDMAVCLSCHLIINIPEVDGTWPSKHCTQHTGDYSQHTYTLTNAFEKVVLKEKEVMGLK